MKLTQQNYTQQIDAKIEQAARHLMALYNAKYLDFNFVEDDPETVVVIGKEYTSDDEVIGYLDLKDIDRWCK